MFFTLYKVFTEYYQHIYTLIYIVPEDLEDF